MYSAGVHEFPKNRFSHLDILDARRLTWRKFHTKDPQKFGATV
jgi:hypothetical protein